MYLSDDPSPELAQPEREVASIRQILAELLVQRGLTAPEAREAQTPSAPWRSAQELSAAA